MDIYPFKICGSGYDIISEKSGYDPFLQKSESDRKINQSILGIKICKGNVGNHIIQVISILNKKQQYVQE